MVGVIEEQLELMVGMLLKHRGREWLGVSDEET